LDCASTVGSTFVNHQISRQQFVTPLPATPVVITGIPTFNGIHPGVVAIDNITNTDFEIQFREWDYLDQNHTLESIDYLAILPGTYYLDDGTIIEADVLQTGGTGQWQWIGLSNSFESNPFVFLTMQTNNGLNSVTPRIRNVTTNSFEVALFEQESLMTTGHAQETVGYIAIYSAANTGLLPIAFQSHRYTVSSIQLAVIPQSVFGQTILLEEEQSADQELLHRARETIHLMQFADMLFGQIASDAGLNTISLRRQ
jgi:hypothetical protein